jgi:antitoxin (DNA-binding transcriptional repressor) of toxin-antitoxin stability system
VTRVKIAALKNNLSRYLAKVRAGDTVLVLDRDRAIARIVPLESGGDERVAELERLGIVRRGKGDFLQWLRKHRPVKVRGGLLKTLLDERRSGW